MKKIVSLLLFVYGVSASAQTWNNDEQYIQKFAMYAVEEMEQYKIPASITLAQGLLETAGGQSRLAQQGKNHFGIKCKEDWTGKTMKHTDDAPNECFRVYDDPRESYRDHSIFLATRKYYVGLFSLDSKDYKAWAHGLKKSGYATNPKYAHILIDRIEKYKLYEFDHITKAQVYTKLMEIFPDFIYTNNLPSLENLSQNQKDTILKDPNYISPSSKKNTNQMLSKEEWVNKITIKKHPNRDLKYFVVPTNGIELSLVAKKFGISEEKLMIYNELTLSTLEKNQIIFLQHKNLTGKQGVYKVERGENMYDISQKFAIKLKKLYSNNGMSYGEQPKEGQILYINTKKPRS